MRNKRVGRQIAFIGLATWLSALLQACSIHPMPKAALPLTSAIARYLGTNEFEITSQSPTYQGAKCNWVGGCSAPGWKVCVRIHRPETLIKLVQQIEFKNGLARLATSIDPDLRVAMIYIEPEGWELIYWDSTLRNSCRSKSDVHSLRPAALEVADESKAKEAAGQSVAPPKGIASASIIGPPSLAKVEIAKSKACDDLNLELSALRTRAKVSTTESLSEQELTDERINLPEAIEQTQARIVALCT